MRVVLFLLLMVVWLKANMGAIILIPTNGKFTAGIYGGAGYLVSRVDVTSTNPALDGITLQNDNAVAAVGGFVGVTNDYYRFSFSYDITSDPDIALQRGLMNFDYMFEMRHNVKYLFGVGFGVAMCAYDINKKHIKQSKGLVAGRVGFQYHLQNQDSVEMMLEYSQAIINNLGKSFYETNDFSTYDIKKLQGVWLRVGYNFLFDWK